MTAWELFHRVLECLYLFSGVAIAVLAAFGLKQLALGKRSLKQTEEIAKTSARREAFKLAAEACHRYLNDLIPAQNKGFTVLRQCGFLGEMEKFEYEFTDTGFAILPTSEFDSATIDKVMEDVGIVEQILIIANGLESFAVPLMSGVASESVVFRSVGATFCDSAKKVIPFLLPLSGGRHFENLMGLFSMWQQRIDLEELGKQKREIAKQIGRKQDIRVTPIGT